jgi:hypothetical protein
MQDLLQLRSSELITKTCLVEFVLNEVLHFSDCMGVREVKPIFQDSVESIGQRDFMVLPTSGYFFTFCKIPLIQRVSIESNLF